MKISIIGTVHAGWTSHQELIDEIKKLDPDNILLELSPEELFERSPEQSMRDEMFAVYNWAKQNNISVVPIDIENDILKEGVTGREAEFSEFEEKSRKILNDYSWKDLNNEAPWNDPEVARLDRELEEKYIDQKKSRTRDERMAANIKDSLVNGNNVVVTGTAHLSFLMERFPEAVFPFRSS